MSTVKMIFSHRREHDDNVKQIEKLQEKQEIGRTVQKVREDEFAKWVASGEANHYPERFPEWRRV